ncbi:hypothetical protein HDU86_002349 [Geranomyces michiganensis]|nr:hypothetical protein HDU86_002349 [Geranomyces michiganensis]
MPTESSLPSSERPTPASSAKTADHVNFIVHGMGRQRRYKENMESMRKTCKEVLRTEFAEQGDAKIEWIPISWHEALHDLSSVDARMNSITLPTCSILRAINNDVLADVLYYFSSFHGQTILNIVAQRLNNAYRDFCEANPDFKGQINLIGHSLGGVILYDLLANIRPAQAKNQTARDGEPPPQPHFEISYPQLSFRPSALFTLGSPVGAVIVMRGQSLSTYRPPRDILFHNLFNILDPLCYRVEPLLDPEYTGVPPILIQRPSARVPTLTYYRQLVSSYLPDLSSTMGAGMSMPASLQLPLGTLKANMAGVVDGLYASVWAAGGFWDDDANAEMDEKVRLAAADDAKEDWAPRKRRRVDSHQDGHRGGGVPRNGPDDEPQHQGETLTVPSSHKRKRVPDRVEEEFSDPERVAKATELLPRRTPRELVSTLTEGVAGSVTSMADAVYNFLSLGSARLAGSDVEDGTTTTVAQDSAETVTNFVDELVGREEVLRMAEHDAEQATTSNPEGSPEPQIPLDSETKHVNPPPHRLDFYISDPMIGTVFQQVSGKNGTLKLNSGY